LIAQPGWGKDRGAIEQEEVAMGFKTGLLVGFGIGYVLGTKAGRERYEELKASWEQFVGKPTVQSVVDTGKQVVQAGKDRTLKAVEKAGDNVKDALEGEGTASTSTSSSSSSRSSRGSSKRSTSSS
jgi:hypothetical protein